MVYVAILCALALERFFDWGYLRRWQWYERYCQLLSPLVDRLNPALRFVAWVVPLVLLAGIVEYILSGWMYGFLRFLFDFVLLLYCFGPVSFWAQLSDCFQAVHQGDTPLLEARVKAAFPGVTASSPQLLHQEWLRAIFIEGNQRIFAVLFWFSFLGPMGALFYRLTVMVNNRAEQDIASVSSPVLSVMEWPASRLLSFLFALGGHFVKVLAQWKKYALQGLNTNDIIVAETGIAALDLATVKPLPENGEVEKIAVQLFDRVLIIMLVLSAILVLIVL